ncbi:hypothetical protein ACS0TY_013187 [Phlomoides rotata]
MTINKAQGQTIQKVGMYLPEHVFSHDKILYTPIAPCNSNAFLKSECWNLLKSEVTYTKK